MCDLQRYIIPGEGGGGGLAWYVLPLATRLRLTSRRLEPRPSSHRLGRKNKQRSPTQRFSAVAKYTEERGGRTKGRGERHKWGGGGGGRYQLTRRSNTHLAVRATHTDRSSSLEADVLPARLPPPKNLRPHRRYPQCRLLMLQLHLRPFEEGVPGPPGA